MVTEGVIDLDTMPDHSDPPQTDAPTNAYALGIIRFLFLVGGGSCSCHIDSFP